MHRRFIRHCWRHIYVECIHTRDTSTLFCLCVHITHIIIIIIGLWYLRLTNVTRYRTSYESINAVVILCTVYTSKCLRATDRYMYTSMYIYEINITVFTKC